MDQEQLAAGGAAISGHQALGLGEPNDMVTEAAAGTAEVSGARSEDQRPRQPSAANSRPRSVGVRTGATTASAAAARARQREDSKDRDFREFDEFVKTQMQQQPQPQTQTQTQQRLTRLLQPLSRSTLQQPPSRSTLQQPPSGSSAEGGGEVAPGPASPDLELRL